jgi:hypothetical protein
LLIEGLGAALATAIAAYIRFGRSNHLTKIRLGVAAIVPHAFGLALLNSWTQQSTTMRPISPVTVLVLFLGMLAPARPTQMLAAGLIAASMDPLGVWIAHLRGLATPALFNTFAMFYPNYVCAVLAVAPARVLHRLGRHLREAGARHYQLRRPAWRRWHGRSVAGASSPARAQRGDQTDTARDAQRWHARAGGHHPRPIRARGAGNGLSSPHTIRLFDFGVTGDGTFYYVMELLYGRDLESLVRNFGPLPPARVMYLIRQVCRSLSEAHATGLIHRDVKPANIYLCRMGLEYDFAKVLDFGLTKRERRDEATAMVTARSRR